MTLISNSFFLKNSRTFIHKLINFKFFLVNVVGNYNFLFLNFILGYDFLLNFYFLDISKLMKLYYNLRLFVFENVFQKSKFLIVLPDIFKKALNNYSYMKNINYFRYFEDILNYFSKVSFFYLFSKVLPGFYTNNTLSLLYDSITNLNRLNVLKYSLFNNHLSHYYNNIFSISLNVKTFFPDVIVLFDVNIKEYILKEFLRMHVPFFCLCDIYCESNLLNFFDYFMLFSKNNYSSYLFNFLLLSFFFFESYFSFVSQNVFYYISNISKFKSKKNVNYNRRTILFYVFLLNKVDKKKFFVLKKYVSFFFLFELFNVQFRSLFLNN